MAQFGIIYSFSRDRYRDGGTVRIAKFPSLRRFAKAAGIGLITLSLATIIFLLTPIALVELRYALERHENTTLAQEEERIAQEEARQAVRNETAALGLTSYFSVSIPKLGAKANIIPNVSTEVHTEYEKALMEGVAHARGTYFPGQGKNVFLFAHSTDSPFNFSRYNAVFYLLGKLEQGDQIVMYFLDRKYQYEVVEKIVTAATDTSWIYRDFGFETVVLQTCDPPGTTWRRLLVLAKAI